MRETLFSAAALAAFWGAFGFVAPAPVQGAGSAATIVGRSYRGEAVQDIIGRSTSQSKSPASQLRIDAARLARVEHFGSLIDHYSQHYQVDPDLVRALIYTESGGDPRALSPKGAMGLMQLMPKTAMALGVEDRFEPEANIAGGVRYLAALLQRFNTAELALWAYNAGPTAVAEGRVPAETKTYVPTVMSIRRYLGQLADE